jgi:hypothetical protein
MFGVVIQIRVSDIPTDPNPPRKFQACRWSFTKLKVPLTTTMYSIVDKVELSSKKIILAKKKN